jgi:hypothetical protein
MKALVAGLLALTAAAALAPRPAAAEPAQAVAVTFDRDRISTALGGTLSLASHITNSGSAAVGRLVAHLNVASLDGVYVDLEDWSSDVTREVHTLAPGDSAAMDWEFHAVNAGTFVVYVVLLPDSGPLVASPSVRVEVTERRTLDAGGALPVVLVVPLLLGLVAAGARYRLRRAA